ncbi:hypothetical protein LOTGIDRAFT_235655 [Lottia gigantea]|uniref:Uncharacterized protein n=1 Tax=Lottia gigantea TaxID=225164 RepID=V3ZU24_LOTGI|nr:hypothetical protein LOTGIDRAFT_235655 [Lottia gigantea]ESO86085.1 hypothetical protein LOTGIDRAFT_235655 [Lottia gigantea]
MNRGNKAQTLGPLSNNSSSLRDQPRRKSTSQVNEGNPPPLPSRKLSDLPPLNKPVTVGRPAPPPTRNPNALRPKASNPNAPALPVRDRSSWTPPNDPFEERFKFHKISDFPPPEVAKMDKKSYPSSLVKQAHTKPPSPPPPPPDQGEILGPLPPPLRSEAPRSLPSRGDLSPPPLAVPSVRSEAPRLPPSRSGSPPPPPLPQRKSTTDRSIFGKISPHQTKM